MPTPKALMRTNSMMTPTNEYKKQLSRLESNKSKHIFSDINMITITNGYRNKALNDCDKSVNLIYTFGFSNE